MMNFSELFQQLTGKPPFPWQQALYDRFVGNVDGGIPQSCSLPTGLGKTSVVAVWSRAIDTLQYGEAVTVVISKLRIGAAANVLFPFVDYRKCDHPFPCDQSGILRPSEKHE